jgi:hypothetical protein
LPARRPTTPPAVRSVSVTVEAYPQDACTACARAQLGLTPH